jgi:hypothetical protein
MFHCQWHRRSGDGRGVVPANTATVDAYAYLACAHQPFFKGRIQISRSCDVILRKKIQKKKKSLSLVCSEHRGHSSKMHSRASSQPSLQQDEQQASDDIMATTSAAVDPHDFHAVVSQDTDSDDNDSSVSVSSCSKKRCRETTVVSSSRRRSPRRHRRRKETEEEEVDEAQTSITLTTNNSHTNREPLFSRLLSPHQQAAIFSPAVRTPHDKKKRRRASDTPGTSSGAKTTNSILRKDATKDNVATNLAQTMEDANTAAPKTTFLQQISSNTPTTIDQHALRYRMSILYPPSKYPALEHKVRKTLSLGASSFILGKLLSVFR